MIVRSISFNYILHIGTTASNMQKVNIKHIQEPPGGKIFLVFLSTILEMTIRRRMDEYLLGDRYSFQDLRDEIFSTNWRKPAGKTFDTGHWCDLPIETQKLFYIFKVTKPPSSKTTFRSWRRRSRSQAK